jgi:2-polyprenyl-3-methyl-5-hydroxy-6-metoxy-1,4-benzoquinol methylase
MSKIIELLHNLKAIEKKRLEIFHPRVRDRDHVKVLRDHLTEVILLSSSNHINEKYYQDRKEKESYNVNNKEIKTPKLNDNMRRVQKFGHYIKNKRWLDFGCGLGGMLKEMSPKSSFAAGLEPNEFRKKHLAKEGFKIYSSIDDIENQSFDIITLFHVLEHLLEPVKTLKILKKNYLKME